MRRAALRVLREPLVQFAAIGAALFALDGLLGGAERAEGEADTIVVTSGTIDQLTDRWAKRRLRPPTAEEVDELIAEHIREEVLYREALALGLDRDDPVIRRLLRQKYEFVTQDLAVVRDPGPDELRAWYEVNGDRYRAEPRLSFTQVHFDADRRGAAARQDALLVLAGLRDGGSPETYGGGDGKLLDPSYADLTVAEVAALFGPEFADVVVDLEPGVWAGPIASGYGLHLVRLSHRDDGTVLPFEAVEARVRSDWAYQQRRDANDAIYARLLARYDVAIEGAAGRAEAGRRP